MAIKITSDSTCDLSRELIDKHSIELFPLYIALGERNLRDGVDVHPDDIFTHVNGGGELAITAAVTPLDYEARFEALSREYDAVIHINIGSAFSACHQNAVIAAEKFRNVYVVDSMNLSSGHGHVVMEAVKRAEAGMQAEAIVRELEELIPRVEASFILDRLDYMARGGRCSTVAALGANVLQLKPCIEVVNGAMRVGTKYRGSFEKCIQKYVKDRLESRDDILTQRIFITHPHCETGDIETAKQAIARCQSFDEVIETNTGCTVASHCGPRTLGVLFIRK